MRQISTKQKKGAEYTSFILTFIGNVKHPLQTKTLWPNKQFTRLFKFNHMALKFTFSVHGDGLWVFDMRGFSVSRSDRNEI